MSEPPARDPSLSSGTPDEPEAIPSGAPVSRGRARRIASALARRPVAGLIAVYALHLALLAYFLPPKTLASGEPLYTIDYALHYYQVDRARSAFADAGRLWGYDPLLLAGQPAGALEDLSSKSLELFVIALSWLGIDAPLAFNLYVLLIHLLVPLFGYGAARLFGLSRWQGGAVALSWVLLWYFDAFFHWTWFCGMISWAFVSCAGVVLVGLAYRALERQRTLDWLAVALLCALLALVHPFIIGCVLIPAVVMVARDARRLRASSWAAIGLCLAASVATAMIWLGPALQMRHYLLPEVSFLHPGLGYVVTDLLDVLWRPLQTGSPVRTMFRTLIFAAAVIALVDWYRRADRRFWPIATLCGSGVLLAYAGGYLWLTRNSQPYRQIMPAALTAAIPAVAALARLLPAIPRASRAIKLLLLLCLLAIVPRAVRTILYYTPDLLPQRGRKERSLWPSALAGLAREFRPDAMRPAGPPPYAAEVRAWLQHEMRGRAGRVLVEEYMLGEYLAASSDLPILGGLAQRNVPHVDAHLFRLQRDGYLPGKRLERYFERYAVRFVVMTQLKRALEWRKKALKFRKLVGTVRIYETRIDPSYFMRGSGRIAAQRFNHLEVADARGSDLVLRFHWMETLRCRPGCRVERQRVAGDRVGFIRVRNPPARFEIYNSYAMREPRWRDDRK